jgi:hypothetical protein
MGSRRTAAFFAFLGFSLCCSLLGGCVKMTRPELVLARRAEETAPSPSPEPSASPSPKSSGSADDESSPDGWFFLCPAEGNTALCGSFTTNLPDGATVQASLRIAPLGGPVELTDTLTVNGSLLCYDFSDRLPRSAIDRQYATLTLCLRFSDPQPKKLTDAYGNTGEKLVSGFVTGKAVSARVEMRFPLPFPDAEAVSGMEMPACSNPTDLVFATSRRYHTSACRYAATAEPSARAYAEHLGLGPCAICRP